jgi:hypothetical protein
MYSRRSLFIAFEGIRVRMRRWGRLLRWTLEDELHRICAGRSTGGRQRLLERQYHRAVAAQRHLLLERQGVRSHSGENERRVLTPYVRAHGVAARDSSLAILRDVPGGQDETQRIGRDDEDGGMRELTPPWADPSALMNAGSGWSFALTASKKTG